MKPCSFDENDIENSTGTETRLIAEHLKMLFVFKTFVFTLKKSPFFACI